MFDNHTKVERVVIAVSGVGLIALVAIQLFFVIIFS